MGNQSLKKHEKDETMNRKKIIRNTIKIIFTLAFVFMVVKTVSVKDVITLFSTLDHQTIFKSLILYLLVNIGRSIRFVLLTDKKTALHQMLPIVLSHGCCNRVLPFRLGESAFPYLMKKVEEVSVSDSVPSVIVVRLFDLFSSVALFVLAYFFCVIKQSLIVCIAVFALLISASVMIFPVIIRILNSKKENIPDNKVLNIIIDGIEKKTDVLNIKNCFLLMIVSIANWILLFLIFQAILLNSDLDIPLVYTILAGSFSNLSSILPLSSIGNFGTMELGWSAVLGMLGYPAEKSLSSGFAVNLCTFLLAIIFGLPGMLYLIVRKKRKETAGTGRSEEYPRK